MDRRGWFLVPHVDDMRRYDGRTARVLHVTHDGALILHLADPLHDGGPTPVTLCGIDLDAARAETRIRSLARGKVVALKLEPHRTRDARGRLVAHVDLLDDVRLNELLLGEGRGVPDERWPHAMLSRYRRAARASAR